MRWALWSTLSIELYFLVQSTEIIWCMSEIRHGRNILNHDTYIGNVLSCIRTLVSVVRYLEFLFLKMLKSQMIKMEVIFFFLIAQNFAEIFFSSKSPRMFLLEWFFFLWILILWNKAKLDFVSEFIANFSYDSQQTILVLFCFFSSKLGKI